MDGPTMYRYENWMEQPIALEKFYGIPQGIEGEGLEGKWPESQDAR
jgi:hypothetical protein